MQKPNLTRSLPKKKRRRRSPSREPDLRIPPADEWGNPFSVTNGPDFVKVESFGPDGKRSEDDFLLAVQWGDGFVNVRRVYFDEELKCQGEEEDYYDW